MKALSAIICASLTLSAMPAAAQSAEAFREPTGKPVETSSPSQTEAPPIDIAVDDLPSRYVGIQLNEYVQARLAALAIRKRTLDPFGQFQDPDAKKPEPRIASAKPGAIPRAAPSVPFSEIISNIPVSTVMGNQRRFLVGNREFREGQRFSLRNQGKDLMVEVVSVSSSVITFRNLATNETGDLRLNHMPAGMSRGDSGEKTPPGVEIADPAAPLEIQPANNQGSY